MSTYTEKYKSFIDDIQDAVGHTLNILSSTTERGLGSIIVLLATGPEFVGSLNTTGSYVIAAAVASSSVIGIRLARRQDVSTDVKIPFTDKHITLSVWWLLYSLQFVLSCLVIWWHGGFIEMAYVGFSFIGGYYSDEVAKVIKDEIADDAKLDLQAAKDAIKLDELKRNAEIRIATKEAKLNTSVGDVGNAVQEAPSVQQKAQQTPDVKHSSVAVTEEQAKIGQQKGRISQQSAAQRRQAALYQMLTDEFNGADVDSLNKSALGKRFEVSSTTIKRDIDALRDAGRINGVVPNER